MRLKIREQDKFTTNVYRRRNFSGFVHPFDSFLGNTNEIGMIYTLLNRLQLVSVPFTMGTLKRNISEKWLSRKLY